MIGPSELIINEDGSVYHLAIQPEQLADTIITVGDPDRVDRVSRHFDHVHTRISKREFLTHIGKLNGKPIMALSTGMGTDNIEIVMNELDALANVDFNSREINAVHRKLNIIRIGTSGSLQKDVPLDAILASKEALGIDTLMSFYQHKHTAGQQQLENEAKTQLSLPFTPYYAQGSEALISQIAQGLLQGFTITCPGFYAPQGRSVRLAPKIDNFIEKLQNFQFQGKVITNFEMETAGYYALANLLGHEALSLNAIVANRIDNTFSSDPLKIMDKLILGVMEKIG